MVVLNGKKDSKFQTNGILNGKTNGVLNGSAITKFEDNNYLEKVSDELLIKDGITKHTEVKQDLKWLNIIGITTLHLLLVYSVFTYPYLKYPQIVTILFALLWTQVGGFGVTAGAHRLWTHRSYKAKLPLRIILMMCYMSAGLNPIYEWVRDHRIHHKFTETDADPHNSKRGFFFAHCGWLMMKKHPEVIRKGKEVDMSDIKNDPVVQFQEKYYVPLLIFFNFILPTCIPVYLWKETWYYAMTSQMFMRYPAVLNGVWSVNSVAHIWGDKPYDRNIAPTENGLVSLATGGEGWHNYHHVFPWDYKCAELGYYLNNTTILIDWFAKIGWAYDLKQPSENLVKTVIAKRGKGSLPRVGKYESILEEKSE